MKHTKDASRSGQAVLVAVLTLGGAILGATTLAGLLMLYEIRATTNSEDSAKAIFAADSGVNWALYSYFQPPAGPLPGLSISATSSVLNNGTALSVECFADDGTVISCDTPATTTVISEGNANGSRRAFFADLTNATGTLP